MRSNFTAVRTCTSDGWCCFFKVWYELQHRRLLVSHPGKSLRAGQKRRWDIVKSLPSVGIVLYHTELDAFLLVRQFRPAVLSVSKRCCPSGQFHALHLNFTSAMRICYTATERLLAAVQVYASNPGSLPQRLEDGFTYEICAGLIDKDKSMLQICREEVGAAGTMKRAARLPLEQ